MTTNTPSHSLKQAELDELLKVLQKMIINILKK